MMYMYVYMVWQVLFKTWKTWLVFIGFFEMINIPQIAVWKQQLLELYLCKHVYSTKSQYVFSSWDG